MEVAPERNATISWSAMSPERCGLGRTRRWRRISFVASLTEIIRRPVPDLGDFTRGWDDGKASAFAAAYAADVAADG